MTDLLFPFVQMLLDTEAVLCNNTKMLRERLNICGDGLGEQKWDQDSEYVYDLYYQEMVTPGWIQDILSVRAYADEGELVRVDGGTWVWSGTADRTGFLSQVPDLVVREEEVYEDEDDENDEANWRNDYPDEESDADDDREERYGGK